MLYLNYVSFLPSHIQLFISILMHLWSLLGVN